MNTMPHIDASGLIPKLSVSVMPSEAEFFSLESMSFLAEWSGKQAYPAAGIITFASFLRSAPLILCSMYADAASAKVSRIACPVRSSCCPDTARVAKIPQTDLNPRLLSGTKSERERQAFLPSFRVMASS